MPQEPLVIEDIPAHRWTAYSAPGRAADHEQSVRLSIPGSPDTLRVMLDFTNVPYVIQPELAHSSGLTSPTRRMAAVCTDCVNER